VNTYLIKIFLKTLEGDKCVCLETLRREWKEFQKGEVSTMKGRIGTQTTLFNLYPKSLVDKLRYVNEEPKDSKVAQKM